MGFDKSPHVRQHLLPDAVQRYGSFALAGPCTLRNKCSICSDAGPVTRAIAAMSRVDSIFHTASIVLWTSLMFT